MRTERVNELKASMKSFGKEKYQKAELLDEMFALQQEIVSLTFNQDHAALAELRIWDVEKHLEQMNEELGNVADEELQRFIEGSKILCNLIKAEISGNRGEAKAFRTLEYIKSRNYVLKNVELSDGDFRTELDAVVITPSGSRFFNGKENEHIEGAFHTLQEWVTDEQNQEFLRKFGWLMKDEVVRAYSAKFKPKR